MIEFEFFVSIAAVPPRCIYDVGVLKMMLVDCWKTWARRDQQSFEVVLPMEEIANTGDENFANRCGHFGDFLVIFRRFRRVTLCNFGKVLIELAQMASPKNLSYLGGENLLS